jgi:hypothetical protein
MILKHTWSYDTKQDYLDELFDAEVTTSASTYKNK